MERKQDGLASTPDYQANRVDNLNEISVPLEINFIKFTPFVSARWTGYTQTLQEDAYAVRFISSEGARIFTQLYRPFNLKEKPLGILNPIHTISIDIRYTNNNYVNTPSSDLYFFDNTDRYDKFQEWFFEIRNRFKSEENEAYKEFLDVGLSIERYSKSISNIASNYLYPMNPLTHPPIENDDFPERKISNLNLDVLLTPTGPLSFRSIWQYNTNARQGEICHFNLSFAPYAMWQASLTGNYVLGRTNTYGLNLSCSPLEKWEISIADQYDFRAGDFVNRRYSLRRDLHEVFIEFSVMIDKGRDEKNFNIMISPKSIKESIMERR
jgi:hypothetical protein